jgi:glycosyltransferase involved in cell wall biosynthesis
MQNRPTISVVIPVYNRSALIGQALDSIARQTLPVDEVVVVDDGSTDGTREAISRHSTPVRYIYQENQGPSAARNKGIKEARGEYIAFLDSDDLWVSRKNEVQVRHLLAHPEIDCLFGDMANFSGDEVTRQAEIKNPDFHRYLEQNCDKLDLLFEWLLKENVIPTPTVMVRRSVFNKVGFLDESLRLAEDYDLWLRLAAECHWGFDNEVLLYRRRHDSNLIGDWAKMNLALLRVLQTTGVRIASARNGGTKCVTTRIRELNYNLGSYFLRTREFRRAHSYLLEAKESQFSFRLAVKLALSALLSPIDRKTI